MTNTATNPLHQRRIGGCPGEVPHHHMVLMPVGAFSPSAQLPFVA